MSKANPPQKVYWLHPHFYNWMGGHKFIYEVITRLKNEYQVEVTLITSGLSKSAEKKWLAAKVPIIKLSGFSTNTPFYWVFLPFFLMWEKWYLKSIKKIDLKAAFISSMFPSNTLAMNLSQKTAQLCYEPFAFFYDQNFLDGFPLTYRLFAHFTKFLYQGLDRRSVRHNQVICTLSEYNRAWIKDAYQVDSVAVYEGVDTEFFRHRVSARLREKYQGQEVIFHSTDYTPIKGTLLLLKALPEIIEKVPQVKLVISETLPNSPLKNEVVALVETLKLGHYVEFAGFLPYDELPEYLSLAKVVVQPSIQQSMNLTVKEAMACGTPIITSLEGHEQTKNGEAGFLLDPTQTSNLAAQTVRCVRDKTLAKKMGQTGRQIIEKKFSWESVTKKIYQSLQKTI